MCCILELFCNWYNRKNLGQNEESYRLKNLHDNEYDSDEFDLQLGYIFAWILDLAIDGGKNGEICGNSLYGLVAIFRI